MSEPIDKMAEQFKTLAELETYSKAQYQTIVTLSKKINQIEAENLELKKKLETFKDDIKKENAPKLDLNVSDEESICRMQLRLLKDLSLERELTLEEAKKVDIYSKILIQEMSKDKPKENANSPDKLDDSALLKFLEDISVNK